MRKKKDFTTAEEIVKMFLPKETTKKRTKKPSKSPEIVHVPKIKPVEEKNKIELSDDAVTALKIMVIGLVSLCGFFIIKEIVKACSDSEEEITHIVNDDGEEKPEEEPTYSAEDDLEVIDDGEE